MCKSSSVVGPGALCAWKAWCRGAWGSGLPGAEGREESQPCRLPAALWAAPVCPLSLRFPFFERRKFSSWLPVCCLGVQDPACPEPGRCSISHDLWCCQLYRLAVPASGAAWEMGTQ